MSSIPSPASSRRRTDSAMAPLRSRSWTRTEPFSSAGVPQVSPASAATASSPRAAVVEADLEPLASHLRLQLVGRALGDHEPVVDHRDPVGEAVGLVEVLRRQEDGRALRDESLDRLPEGDAAAQVEPCRRLVEEQDRWAGDERGAEVEPSPHAAGVRADEPLARVGQVEGLEQLGRALARDAAAEVVEPADHLQVLEAGQVLVHGRVLAGEPDPLSDPGRVADDVEACDARLAAVGLEQRGQDPDGGRLARAVRPEQPEDAPGLGVQVDAAQGDDVPVALGQPSRLDCGCVRHPRQATGACRPVVVATVRSGR